MNKSLILAVAAIAVLSSCNKENIEAPEETNAPVFSATIEGNAVTKTQLAKGSATGKNKVEWLSTDEVTINGVDINGDPTMIADYTVTPGTDATTASLTAGNEYIDQSTVDAANYYAFYPKSANLLTHTLEKLGATTKTTAQTYLNIWKEEGSLPYFLSGIYFPSTQKYNGADISEVAPMVAVNDGGTELAFKNLTAILAIMVPADDDFKSVDKIKVTADKPINGSYSVDFSDESLPLTLMDSPSEVNYSVTLDCQGASIPSGGTRTFYISIPAQQYGYINVAITDGRTTMTKNTKDGATITVERNKIYPINFPYPESNLLPGEFSVSETKKVRFTKGNLQAIYDGSSKIYTWGFAENQYSIAGDTNGNNSTNAPTDGKVIDLFGYSTATTYYGITNNPNRTSFAGDFIDWGKNFPDAGYYTLSKDEWSYLLNGRTVNGAKGESRSYRRTTLTLSNSTTVYGLLIAPDNYTGSLSDTISWSDWQTMEASGVVFLPATGYRTNTFVVIRQYLGLYWTSTPYDSVDYAYRLDFDQQIVDVSLHYYRSEGIAVRLVKEVE